MILIFLLGQEITIAGIKGGKIIKKPEFFLTSNCGHGLEYVYGGMRSLSYAKRVARKIATEIEEKYIKK